MYQPAVDAGGDKSRMAPYLFAFARALAYFLPFNTPWMAKGGREAGREAEPTQVKSLSDDPHRLGKEGERWTATHGPQHRRGSCPLSIPTTRTQRTCSQHRRGSHPLSMPATCTHATGHDTDNTTRHDATRRDTTRHNTTRHDTTRHDTTRHGTAVYSSDGKE